MGPASGRELPGAIHGGPAAWLRRCLSCVPPLRAPWRCSRGPGRSPMVQRGRSRAKAGPGEAVSLMVCISNKNCFVSDAGPGGGCHKRVAVATSGGGLTSWARSRRPLDSRHHEQGAECVPWWTGTLPQASPALTAHADYLGLGFEMPHLPSHASREAQRAEAGTALPHLANSPPRAVAPPTRASPRTPRASWCMYVQPSPREVSLCTGALFVNGLRRCCVPLRPPSMGFC